MPNSWYFRNFTLVIKYLKNFFFVIFSKKNIDEKQILNTASRKIMLHEISTSAHGAASLIKMKTEFHVERKIMHKFTLPLFRDKILYWNMR